MSMSVKGTMVAAAKNASTQLDHSTALVMLAINCTSGTAAHVGYAHHSFSCALSQIPTNLHHVTNSMEYRHSQKVDKPLNRSRNFPHIHIFFSVFQEI
jgi:hypothetical protein